MANPAKLCEMKQVESSQISKVGYTKSNEKDKGFLFIDFSRNPETKSIYLYYPVSEDTYTSLIEAESVGRYFSSMIKNNESITCIKLP